MRRPGLWQTVGIEIDEDAPGRRCDVVCLFGSDDVQVGSVVIQKGAVDPKLWLEQVKADIAALSNRVKEYRLSAKEKAGLLVAAMFEAILQGGLLKRMRNLPEVEGKEMNKLRVSVEKGQK